MAYATPASTREITFPGAIAEGATGIRAKRVQEWLTWHGTGTPIDSDYGPATAAAVKRFQQKAGLPQTGAVNQPTWDALVAPMVKLLNLTVPGGSSYGDAVLKLARAHAKIHPIELGGDNCGAWVRMYCDGNDGTEWKWCACFVTFVLKQASHLTGTPVPIAGSPSCDTLAAQAKLKSRFVRGTTVASGATPWARLAPCSIFLVRRTATDWTHTGFAFNGAGGTFDTIEGNTDTGGSSNGWEVTERTRGVAGKDFIIIT